MKQSPNLSKSRTPEFEAKFVRPKLGRALIVGSYVTEGKVDRRTLYPDARGIDMRAGPGVDIVFNMESTEIFTHQTDRFDHVDCLSVLEHCERPWLVAQNIQSLMTPGGTLFISVPFVWRPHAYPSDYWRMTIEAVRSIFDRIEWEQLLYSNHSLGTSMNGMGVHDKNGYICLPRTEVLGFGRLK